MRYLLLPVVAMILAACGVRDQIPEDADHPLVWWVGLTLGGFLLSGAIWMLDGVFRRHGRRADRRDDRGRDDE